VTNGSLTWRGSGKSVKTSGRIANVMAVVRNSHLPIKTRKVTTLACNPFVRDKIEKKIRMFLE
jgi:hypothetical protein